MKGGSNRTAAHALGHGHSAARVEVDRLAREAAQRRLEQAVSLLLNAERDPILTRRFKLPNGRPGLATFDRRGVVRVVDLTTGDLLAESVPGQPGRLRPGFLPGPDPRASA